VNADLTACIKCKLPFSLSNWSCSDGSYSMRLLNCDTGQLEEFFNANAPSYTILSHTWGKQEKEVNYQDMCSPETTDPARKKGYNKLMQCCDQTLRMGKTYTWIDTCSINKSSSAELSEAINSMYKWYRDADICFVYLADVHVTQMDQSFEASFIKSRWFSRGWTLQELIAPRQLLFFNATWTSIGTKATLLFFISKATGIDKNTLLNPELSSLSIARKMSWASKRQTTRSEDIALLLLSRIQRKEVPIQSRTREFKFDYLCSRHKILANSSLFLVATRRMT
jgi:hypothetical protein